MEYFLPPVLAITPCPGFLCGKHRFALVQSCNKIISGNKIKACLKRTIFSAKFIAAISCESCTVSSRKAQFCFNTFPPGLDFINNSLWIRRFNIENFRKQIGNLRCYFSPPFFDSINCTFTIFIFCINVENSAEKIL